MSLLGLNFISENIINSSYLATPSELVFYERVVEHLVAALPPFVFDLKKLMDEVSELGVVDYLGVVVPINNILHRFLLFLVEKRRRVREHLVSHASDRPQVNFFTVGLVREDFWGGIIECA